MNNLFDAPPADPTPALKFERNSTRRMLDELFTSARRYRTTADYAALLQFIRDFHWYAPYNAMLVHIQMPGASFVATSSRWQDKYQRHTKASARPLVIMQPGGPVMFVFDLSDTEPIDPANALPVSVETPFQVQAGHIKDELALTIENARRDGIAIEPARAGSSGAGSIGVAKHGRALTFGGRAAPVSVPLRYQLTYNDKHSAETAYATVVHELAHLYCGHLGTPNKSWWHDRRGLSHEVEEFEAESVSYLVCGRLGLDSPADRYLARYFDKNAEVPSISVDRVMTTAGAILKMAEGLLPPRKENAA